MEAQAHGAKLESAYSSEMDTHANGVEQRQTLWITSLSAHKEAQTMRTISLQLVIGAIMAV
jgi:hypothetical protein